MPARSRNLDPLVNPVVVRDDVLAAAADPELADHRWMGAAQHLDDLAVGAAVRLDPRDADHHAVAVHRLLGGVGRDENVARESLDGTLGNQEAVAIAMHLEAADRELARARGDGVMAGTQFDEVAAGGEPGQRRLELFALAPAGPGLADELFEVGAGMREPRDMVEQRPIRHNPILLSTRGQSATSG
jgi:hypothetical protein